MKRTSGSKRRNGARHNRARRVSAAALLLASLGAGVAARAQEQEKAATPPPPPPAQKGPTEPIPAEGNTIVVNGDTMWDLSGRFLGSPYEWPRLWSYNPEITNPHWIYPGHVLRLRENAEGGTSVAPPPGTRGPAPGSAGGVAAGDEEGPDQSGLISKSSRFGQGFGVRALGRRDGSIMVGEQVFLDKKALDHSGKIIGSSEDHMMLSPSDEVYVKFGDGVTPVQGKEMTIFRHTLKKENSPNAAQVYVVPEGTDKDGEIVSVLGSLRVQSYDEKNRIARAVITEALDPIERGFEVTDVPRQLVQVPPRTNDRKIESKILAATRPLGTLGHNQLVFIGVGEKQGVKPGNRFLVVRQGDAWRQELTLKETETGAERPSRTKPKDSQYPWEPVAEVRILYVRQDTCTGIITSSRVEVGIGDRVEMPEGY